MTITDWACTLYFPARADGALSLGAAVGVGGAGPSLEAGVVEAAVERVAEPPGRTLADRAVTCEKRRYVMVKKMAGRLRDSKMFREVA